MRTTLTSATDTDRRRWTVNPVPPHRALLGVDVVGSARKPRYRLNPMRAVVEDMLCRALEDSGVPDSEVLTWAPTGGGALLTLPGRWLGVLLDLGQRLDRLAAEHNRRHQLEARLRITVDLDPVGDETGPRRPGIPHTRLPNAELAKQLLERCLRERADGAVHTVLVVSDHAFRSAFGKDRPRLVQQGDFAPVSLQDKEHSGTVWVQVPGFDAHSITELARQASPQQEPPQQQA